MCSVLSVSKSGFYKWLNAPISARKRERAELVQRVNYHFEDNYKRYGATKITDCLKDEGKRVSEKTVGRIMRENNLRSCIMKKFKIRTTDSNHKLPVADNILNQQFHTTAPNKVWVTDITYIWTRQGRLYLACVMNLFTRKIVGSAPFKYFILENCGHKPWNERLAKDRFFDLLYTELTGL